MKALSSALLIVSTLSISASAVAGTIAYDFRADYSNLSFTSNIPSSSRLYLRTGRLDFKGNLNDSVSYQARWAFNKPAVASVSASGTSNQTRDALNNSVELAYITHKMSDLFALSIGKFNTEIGGFEGATSGADLYLVSPMYGGLGAYSTGWTGDLPGSNLATNAGNPNLLYATGLKGVFTLSEGQAFALVATNNATDSVDAGGRFAQNRGMLGAIYKGAYMDKTLLTTLSYHEVSPQAATGGVAVTARQKHSFIAAGVKYDAQPTVVSLEYLTTDFKDDATGAKDKLNVVVTRLGYTIDQWTPRLEGFFAEEIRDSAAGVSTTNKYTGVGAVLEYKPTEDNFRYHLAYNTITDAPATGSEVSRSEIVLGARLYGDFLK